MPSLSKMMVEPLPGVGVGGTNIAVEVSVGSSSVEVGSSVEAGNSKVEVTCAVGDGCGAAGK